MTEFRIFKDRERQMATDDFVAWYGNPYNRKGWQWSMVRNGVLPENVNENDERVKEIVRLAKEEY